MRSYEPQEDQSEYAKNQRRLAVEWREAQSKLQLQRSWWWRLPRSARFTIWILGWLWAGTGAVILASLGAVELSELIGLTFRGPGSGGGPFVVMLALITGISCIVPAVGFAEAAIVE